MGDLLNEALTGIGHSGVSKKCTNPSGCMNNSQPDFPCALYTCSRSSSERELTKNGKIYRRRKEGGAWVWRAID